MPKTDRTITDAVHDVMNHLPETEEFVSHGAPTFRVRGKIFATYTINSHGDGRVSLNLKSPKGAQAMYTKVEPKIYFVPPYTGPKGWLGIQLDQGLSWKAVAEHACDAYETVAPQSLIDAIDRNVRIKPPSRKFRPEEIDPFVGKRAKAILKRLAKICLALPETSPSTQYGNPTWLAGKKTFVNTSYYDGQMKLSFWVGAARQKSIVKDKRFRVSPFTGHNGWIDLDVNDLDTAKSAEKQWTEIELLVLESYRHFAIKRMLKALNEGSA